MEFKGTKGKWLISKRYDTITDEQGLGIAQGHGISNIEQWSYNAQLIAHAPEMLEMLIDILEQENITQSAHDEIQQLITKATTI